MTEDIVFISMEGKKDFKIGNFLVREDISLPVYIKKDSTFSIDKISPENIIVGIIRVLSDNADNEHIDYYRDLIFAIQPEIEARLSSVAYEAKKNHHFDDALEMHRVLYSLNPNSLEQNLNIAICYDEYAQHLSSRGIESEASKLEDQSYHFFKKVDSFEDKDHRAYYHLGRFYLLRENHEKAIEYFKEFIEITDDVEKKNEVLKLLKNIVSEGVMDEDYQNAIGLIHADKEKDAIEYIDRFSKKYSNSWNAYFVKGWALRKMQKYLEAVSFFEKALKLNSESSDIYNELGICYMNLNIFHKSKSYFSKALTKAPDDTAILNNLALCSFKKGDKKEALKYCEVILEFNPKDLQTQKLLKVIEENGV